MNTSKPEPVRAVDKGVPADQWRRVHPISPVLNAWKALAALLAFIVYQNAELVTEALQSSWARSTGMLAIGLIVIGVVIVFLIIAGIYSWLAWRATSYAVTDEAVWFRSGILFRTQRHARLDRIQAVDIVHPLLGRLFGLGRLSVEVAGGAGSNFSFGYLTNAVLDDLRAEILARAAGLKLGTAQATPTGTTTDRVAAELPDANAHQTPPGSVSPALGAPTSSMSSPDALRTPAPVAEERLLYEVPTKRLIVSLLLSIEVIISLLVAVGLLLGAIITAVRVGAVGLNVLWGFIPGILGVGSFLWGRFAGEFNFKAAVSADGIRIRRGLTETRSQTIPPRRIHAVRIVQPVLWKKKQWYRVVISQAGYAGESGQSGGAQASDVLLPVGTRAEAELALWLVMRDLGVDDPLAFIEAGLNGEGEGQGFIPNPERSKRLDPLVWRRRAVALTRTAMVIRDGRLYRKLTFAPAERLQSLAIDAGPWLRRLNLATLRMQIVPGTVRAVALHMDAEQAKTTMAEVVELASVRRVAEPPDKWMMRVSAVVDEGGVGEPTPGESPDVPRVFAEGDHLNGPGDTPSGDERFAPEDETS